MAGAMRIFVTPAYSLVPKPGGFVAKAGEWVDPDAAWVIVRLAEGDLVVASQRVRLPPPPPPPPALILPTGIAREVPSLLIGGTKGIGQPYPINGDLHIHICPDDAQRGRILIDGFGSHTYLSFRRAEGTKAAPAALTADTDLGGINVFGYGATGYCLKHRGAVSFYAGENWSDSAQGTYARILTTPNGTVAPVDALHISDGGIVLCADGDDWLSPGVKRLRAVTANTTISIPAGWAIAAIHYAETAGNDITDGVKIGATDGAADVVAAQAVDANAIGTIADADILRKVFSRSDAQTLFVQAVSSWNSASVEFSFALIKVF